MGNIRVFVANLFYFKFLAAGAIISVAFLVLLVWYVGFDAHMSSIVKVSAAQLEQMARVRQQPAVLGAATQFTQTQLHIYKPKTQPKPQTYATTPQVYHSVPTTEPVIFITIDDGVVPDEAGFRELQNHGAVATLFLNDEVIKAHYDYFARWQAAGSSIQNHTLSHQVLEQLTHERQVEEICGNSLRMKAVFGTDTPLFRPPFGGYNDSILYASAECGVKAIVHWAAEVKDGKIDYQQPNKLRPGDIVLLHFTDNLKQDLQVLFAAAEAEGLQIGRLEDWLY